MSADYLEHKLSRLKDWLDDPEMVEVSINPDRKI